MGIKQIFTSLLKGFFRIVHKNLPSLSGDVVSIHLDLIRDLSYTKYHKRPDITIFPSTIHKNVLCRTHNP